MAILTLQCPMSRSAQFRAIIMNCGVSYPCIQLPFIRFGVGGEFGMKMEAHTRECMPAGCHSLS